MSNKDLVWSLKNGDLDEVERIMNAQKIDPNEVIDGRPLIHYAADYGQKDVLHYLIEIGADVNSIDKHGISALLAAIWEGHTDCVELLLLEGADRNGRTPDGKSYKDVASKREIVDLLV